MDITTADGLSNFIQKVCLIQQPVTSYHLKIPAVCTQDKSQTRKVQIALYILTKIIYIVWKSTHQNQCYGVEITSLYLHPEMMIWFLYLWSCCKNDNYDAFYAFNVLKVNFGTDLFLLPVEWMEIFPAVIWQFIRLLCHSGRVCLYR